MATLQLIWDAKFSYQLSAWDQGNFHQAALITRQIQSNILVADLGPIADTPTSRVIVKIARGERANDNLEREYEMYTGRLVHLQGSVIPRCYGLFKGRADEVKFGCLLLEYIKPHKDKMVDVDEFHRQLMLGLCKIHKAGVKHNDLTTNHIVQMGYSPRIIDFSRSEKHECRRTHPASPSGEHSDRSVCKELSRMEVFHLNDPKGIVMFHHNANRKRMTLSGDSHPVHGGGLPFPPPMTIPPLSYYDPLTTNRDGHPDLRGHPSENSSHYEHQPYLRTQRSKRSFAGHRTIVPAPLNLQTSAVVSQAYRPSHETMQKPYPPRGPVGYTIYR